MIIYAVLNELGVVTGLSALSGKVDQPNMIEIVEMDYDLMNRKYENGEWSMEKFVPDYSQIELTRMEALEQSQTEQDEAIMLLMLGGM